MTIFVVRLCAPGEAELRGSGFLRRSCSAGAPPAGLRRSACSPARRSRARSCRRLACRRWRSTTDSTSTRRSRDSSGSRAPRGWCSDSRRRSATSSIPRRCVTRTASRRRSRCSGWSPRRAAAARALADLLAGVRRDVRLFASDQISVRVDDLVGDRPAHGGAPRRHPSADRRTSRSTGSTICSRASTTSRRATCCGCGSRTARGVIVRPSGTEPKLKLYLDVRGDSAEDAATRVAALAQGASAMLDARADPRHPFSPRSAAPRWTRQRARPRRRWRRPRLRLGCSSPHPSPSRTPGCGSSRSRTTRRRTRRGDGRARARLVHVGAHAGGRRGRDRAATRLARRRAR